MLAAIIITVRPRFLLAMEDVVSALRDMASFNFDYFVITTHWPRRIAFMENHPDTWIVINKETMT